MAEFITFPSFFKYKFSMLLLTGAIIFFNCGNFNNGSFWISESSSLMELFSLPFLFKYQKSLEIKITKLGNIKIQKQSTIYTNEHYPTFKFFKVDLNSIPDLTDINIFSFIKITVKKSKRNSYKTFALYANKTLYDFQDSTEYIIDYNIQDKHPTIFIPKKYFKSTKFFYFLVQSEKNTEFEYIIETFITDITISDSENKFNILFKPGKIDLHYRIQKDMPKGYLLFGLLTTGVIEDGNDLYLDVICPNKKDGNNSIGKYYPYFINGIGSLVTDTELIDCKNMNGNNEDNEIYIKITLYNDLRKTAKFTAAQNKEEKSEFIDSVG